MVISHNGQLTSNGFFNVGENRKSIPSISHNCADTGSRIPICSVIMEIGIKRNGEGEGCR